VAQRLSVPLSLLVESLVNRTLLGTLSPGKDADVVLRRLSPSECFEQDEVVLYKAAALVGFQGQGVVGGVTT